VALRVRAPVRLAANASAANFLCELLMLLICIAGAAAPEALGCFGVICAAAGRIPQARAAVAKTTLPRDCAHVFFIDFSFDS
jgi:hypothetical protein